VISAGEKSVTFTLDTIADDLAEGTETISINIDSITGGGFESIAEHATKNNINTNIAASSTIATTTTDQTVSIPETQSNQNTSEAKEAPKATSNSQNTTNNSIVIGSNYFQAGSNYQTVDVAIQRSNDAIAQIESLAPTAAGNTSNNLPVAEDNLATVIKGVNGVDKGNLISDNDYMDNNQDTIHVDFDVDGHTLTVTKINGIPIEEGVFQGKYGTLKVERDGSYEYLLDENSAEVQQLSADVIINDEFTYTIDDGNGGMDEAKLIVKVRGSLTEGHDFSNEFEQLDPQRLSLNIEEFLEMQERDQQYAELADIFGEKLGSEITHEQVFHKNFVEQLKQAKTRS
jgi:VCBS repeat-containing protein